MPKTRADVCYRLLGITSECVEEANKKRMKRSASAKRHVVLLAELREIQAVSRRSGRSEDLELVLQKIYECRNYIIANRHLHPNFHQHMDNYDLYHMEAMDGFKQRDFCLDYCSEGA